MGAVLIGWSLNELVALIFYSFSLLIRCFIRRVGAVWKDLSNNNQRFVSGEVDIAFLYCLRITIVTSVFNLTVHQKDGK